ncbi:aldo/keto reductase [Kitasatospora sp. NPDC049285]|uniref:aldo/keto reductase n=1 Tax=Kitasatospora sp. NPDC049285 TaxID=3157096 RepID=UPI003437430F
MSEQTTIDAAAAGQWKLGDLTVHRMGYGAMRTTGSGGFDRGTVRPREQSIAVLREAVERGVNHIDTAAFYFSALRSANELINSALAPYSEELVITTKVGPGRDSWGEWHWAEPAQLRGQVEENLRQLGRDHLDVVNLRLPNRPVDVAEHFGALAELRTAGLIRQLGLSNASIEQLDAALTVAPVVCVQNRYGLGSRDSDELLRRCGESGIAFVPFFAIAGDRREGALAEQAAGEHPEVEAVAAAHGITPAQLRLAWTLHQGPHVLAIPGTGNPAHLRENLAAAAVRLTPEDLARLDAAG